MRSFVLKIRVLRRESCAFNRGPPAGMSQLCGALVNRRECRCLASQREAAGAQPRSSRARSEQWLWKLCLPSC